MRIRSVSHPRAFLALHGPVLISPEFMPPWRERLVRFYEQATARLMPRNLLEQIVAIDTPSRAFPVRARHAVAWGLADFVGDESFARRLALGEVVPPFSPRHAAMARGPLPISSAELPPGRPQGIIARDAIQIGAVGRDQQSHTRSYSVDISGLNFFSDLYFGVAEPDTNYSLTSQLMNISGTPSSQPSPTLWTPIKNTWGIRCVLDVNPGTGCTLTYSVTVHGLRNGG